MAYEVVDPSTLSADQLEDALRNSPVLSVTASKFLRRLAEAAPRVLVEARDPTESKRIDHLIAAYVDIRSSRAYPKLTASIKCEIEMDLSGRYSVQCRRKHGDQREMGLAVTVVEYRLAKAYVLAWIPVSEKWIGESWAERPISPSGSTERNENSGKPNDDDDQGDPV
jgi:hypothetical protein